MLKSFLPSSKKAFILCLSIITYLHSPTATCRPINTKLVRDASGPEPTVRSSAVAVWGSLAKLPGTSWIVRGEGYDQPELYQYQWNIPWEQMDVTVHDFNGKVSKHVFSLDLSGKNIEIQLSTGVRGVFEEPRPGIVIQNFPKYRVIMRFGDGRISTVQELMQDGKWTLSERQERIIANESDIQSFKKSSADAEDALLAKWGDLYKLTKRPGWLYDKSTLMIVSFTDSSHSKIKWTMLNDDFSSHTLEWSLSDKPDKYGRIKFVEPSAYGAFMSPKKDVIVTSMLRYKAVSDDRFEYQYGTYDKKLGEFKQRSLYQAMVAVDQSKINGWFERKKQAQATLQQRSQAQIQAQAQQATREEKKSGGGLFGLLGQAAQAYTLATDDNAYRAAVVGALNNETQGLGTALGIVADGGSGGAASVGSVTSAAGAARGNSSYPTKPNLALQACPGFSESNYRTRAFEGGGDTQLFTMCGQAFELYVMYKRAISQGYSEMDANRTYDAHEKAALNAQNFAANWAAK